MQSALREESNLLQLPQCLYFKPIYTVKNKKYAGIPASTIQTLMQKKQGQGVKNYFR